MDLSPLFRVIQHYFIIIDSTNHQYHSVSFSIFRFSALNEAMIRQEEQRGERDRGERGRESRSLATTQGVRLAAETLYKEEPKKRRFPPGNFLGPPDVRLHELDLWEEVYHW